MSTFTGDVIIYGATPAGILAAKALSASGRTAYIVNPYGSHYGGMFTGGLSAIDFGANGSLQSIVGGYTKAILDSLNTTYGLAANSLPKPEPHAAVTPITTYRTATGLTTRPNERITSVTKNGNRIASFATDGSNTYVGTVFIDASYEGDLMAMAGVSYGTGREAASSYYEDTSGASAGGLGGYGSNVQNQAINLLDSNGQRLNATGPIPKASIASGDAYQGVQAPNFRVVLTSTTAKKQAFTQPSGYAASDYKALANWLLANTGTVVKLVGSVGGTDCVLGGTLLNSNSGSSKYDCNTAGLISSNFFGAGYGYPSMIWAYLNASTTTRTAIQTAVYKWIAGMLYFVANDASLSGTAVQTDAATYAYCNDEFQADFFGIAGFPPQLYLREGRRMVGQYVMKLSDVMSGATKTDSVCRFNYSTDVHPSQMYPRSTNVAQSTIEGGFGYASPASAYQIPWRSLLPVKNQADNLIVPVCLSASHLAWGAMRLELALMMCGEAAGWGANAAIAAGVDPVNLSASVVQAAVTANGGII